MIATARWPWFEVDVRGDRIILSGELDLASGATLEDAARHVAELVPGSRAVLDLGGLTFLDTAGLDGLHRFEARLRDAGLSVAVGHECPALVRLCSLLTPSGEPGPPGRAAVPPDVHPR